MKKRVAFDASDTERIAELARLELSDAEKNRICSELGEMLLFVSALEGVDEVFGNDIGVTRRLSELRADEPSEAINYRNMGIDCILTNDYLKIKNALNEHFAKK